MRVALVVPLAAALLAASTVQRAGAQQPSAPPAARAAPAGAAGGLSVPQALALRTVTNPRLGDDFVAFTLLVPRPLGDGPGAAYQHVGVIDGLAALAPDTRPAVKWLVGGPEHGKQTAPAMQVRSKHREVSFLRVADGRPQLFVQSIDGGAARRWADTPALAGYRWRPDGAAVSFTALDPLPEARSAAKARGIEPVIVDEDWRHLSLWLVEDGGEPKRLTSGTTVFEHEWAPDGTRIACACAPRNTVDDSYMFQRLHVLDVATGALAKLVDNPGKLGPFAWSPDGTKLAYITAADRNDPHAGSIAIATIATGEVTLRQGPFMAEALQWVPSGAPAQAFPLALIARGTRSALLGPDVSGESAEGVAAQPEGLAVTALAAGADTIVCAASTSRHPAELFVSRPSGAAGSFRRLTVSNQQLDGVTLGEQTVEKVRTRDGLQIEGVLIKPVGYEAGRKYPFVIVVHGGPEAHFSDGWLTNYSNGGQLLAARGYVSWYPNYRSSTGYGTAFCKHDHGDPMGKEFLDHLDAIDHFAGKGLIDRERVGITGGSYGGYTAAWAATKGTEHFAAAISFVPFTDIRTKWLTSDIPFEFFFVHYQEQWPWQQPGLLADRSPLTWAPQCRTPLLLLGGTADPRVHPSQPFLLYRAVKFATDTPVRYVQYPGEGHGNRTNVYQLDYAVRQLQWLDHYLRGDGTAAERRAKAPPPLDLDYPQ
jgi:dipeptidyl aminopeptidase/acylaminoacyl peptidase